LGKVRYGGMIRVVGAFFLIATLVAACFQPAGSGITPSPVDVAALTMIPPTLTATEFPLESPTEFPTNPPPLETPTPAPFITPLPPEGFTPPTATFTVPTPTDIPTVDFPTTAPEGLLTPTEFVVFPTLTPNDLGVLPATPTETAPLLPTPTALPTDNPCVHTVQPGEWLLKIARERGIDAQALLAANPSVRGRETNLQPGETLIIPNCNAAPTPIPPPNTDGLPATPTALPTANPCDYIVQPGDTLYQIARKFGVDVQVILAANPRLAANPNSLSVGQQIAIPNCTVPTVAPAQPGQPAAPTNPATPIILTDRIYTVVEGDTMGAIARKFGITVQALKAANNLANDFLRVGQQLKIPAP